jgi:Macrocin-O-methyltransferase (TylF)
MKSLVKSAVRKASRTILQDVVFRRPRGDSFDMLDIAFFTAAMDSARFYEEFMLTARAFETDLSLLSHAMSVAPTKGLILEFGVASGRTIRHIAGLTGREIHGFDSFEGLPESWRTGFDQGMFAQPLPDVPAHVSLHKGWFTETLPPFVHTTSDPVALLHIDCDLYSSTTFVLNALADRIGAGTVIVFDEYFNYPGWKQHEHKAFQEFVAKTGLTFRFDSFVPSHQQVGVVIKGKSVGG